MSFTILKAKINSLFYKVFRKLPLQRKTVLFISYYGNMYGCNPKYISEWLTSNWEDKVNVVWAFSNPTRHNIDGVKKVKYASIRYFHTLATCRIVCTNYRMTNDFEKRSGQIYIQTWHSSLRLKKIEKDTEATLKPSYVSMAKLDSSQIDYIIAGCEKSAETFEKSFWYNGKILCVGTPRNDLLINQKHDTIKKVRDTLGICEKKKIVLYAPTFRENKSTECYNIDFNVLRESLHKRFGMEWQIIIRLHPHLIGKSNFSNMQNVIDATEYDDIQELLSASDVLITDYSSLMFDFAISGRPIFLYTPDIKDYCQKERNLYFNINELPFIAVSDNVTLKNAIEGFDDQSYNAKLNEFNSKIGNYENGTASKAVANLIINELLMNYK